MPVVTHQAVTAKPYLKPLDPFDENLLKSCEIGILFEYPQATISTVEHMINITTKRNSFRASHRNQKLVENKKIVKKRDRTPDTFNSSFNFPVNSSGIVA